MTQHCIARSDEAPADPNAAERRAYPRRAIRLAATIGRHREGPFVGEIRDFCRGGLFIACERDPDRAEGVHSPLRRGDLVEVRCHVPSQQGKMPVLLHGRVVRVGPRGLGLAFTERSDAAIAALEACATRAMAPSSDRSTIALRDELAKIATATGRALVEIFLAAIPQRLFTAAEAVPGLAERNAYYEAADAFAKRRPSFGRDFEQALRQAFEAPPPRRAMTRSPPAAGGGADLCLVDNDEFEDWLVYSEMLRQAEQRFDEALKVLDARLQVALSTGREGEHPFAPASYCHAFQSVLAPLGLSRPVLAVAYATFEDALCGEAAADAPLGKLYHELNAVLVARGVLPNDSDVFRAVATSMRRPSGSSPPGSDRMHPGRETVATIAAESSPETLQQMIADFARASAARGQSAYVPARDVARFSPPPLAPQEIVAALSPDALGRLGLARVPGDLHAARTRVVAALEHQAGQRLGQRDSEILDRTARLVDAICAERDVADPLRAWLGELLMPLSKLALTDDAFFRDRAHPARQFVDDLARLELPRAGTGATRAVHDVIESLVRDLASAGDLDRSLRAAVRRTRGLLQLQSSAYDDNVRDVVARCEAPTQAGPAAAAMSRATEGEVGPCRERVKRLRAGQALSLDVGSGPRKLKIAWIAPDGERFALVNGKGLQEAAMTAEELASHLRGGTAAVEAQDTDSHFDRAHYQALSSAHRDLVREATHDTLTGMLDRREFERRLVEALTIVRATGRPHAVAFVDLDRFAEVNDAFGYAGGDRLLAEVAALLARAGGEDTVVARLAGDQFGILYRGASAADAVEMLAAQRAAVDNYRLEIDGETASVAFSAGLAAIVPDMSDGAAILQAAEASCRIARRRGKPLQLFEGCVAVAASARLGQWARRIDDVLRNDLLALRAQPVVSVSGHARVPHHAEVLLAVPNEAGGFDSPVDFVHAAEQLRRMPSVDRWVIEHAFAWMAGHPEALAALGGLAINLSGASMSDDGLADWIVERAHVLAVPFDRVSFEVTETASIENLASASELMRTLKAHGCAFALDDFGSGLSSYAYLKNLPVEFVKIDGAFVRDMAYNDRDRAVVKSITEIGHFMGMKVIGEHVESDAVLELLREIGVDYAQGYATGKPRLLAEL